MLITAIAVADGRTSAPPDPRVAGLLPQLGRLLMVGVPGTEVQPDGAVERLLRDRRVGGVVLFARNITDAAQLARFTGALRERARHCAGQTLLVAVDAEGGRVMRLGPPAGFTPTLSAEELGQANDLALTELEARRIGARLRTAGIDGTWPPSSTWATTPPIPSSSAKASFSANPLLVASHAQAFIRGLRAEGADGPQAFPWLRLELRRLPSRVRRRHRHGEPRGRAASLSDAHRRPPGRQRDDGPRVQSAPRHALPGHALAGDHHWTA